MLGGFQNREFSIGHGKGKDRNDPNLQKSHEVRLSSVTLSICTQVDLSKAELNLSHAAPHELLRVVGKGHSEVQSSLLRRF